MSLSLIASRTFTFDDQEKFAKISGDFNPIHVDPHEAKKTVAGECIVHGINAFLWAYENLLQKLETCPTKITINFKDSIKLDSRVHLYLDSSKNAMELVSDEGKKLCLLKYETDRNIKNEGDAYIGDLKKMTFPEEIDFENIELNKDIKLAYGGAQQNILSYFSTLSEMVGVQQVYEISLLSNIVGMQMPGLHSMFISCQLFLETKPQAKDPTYKVTEKHEKFRMLKIKYSGKNIDSEILALERPFYRPKLCKDLLKYSEDINGNFDGMNILVVGGSRGIGAIFSKLAAVCGANVTITYSTSEQEAKAICQDIAKYSHTSPEYKQLDVTNSQELDNFSFDYDVMCYFASPKIFGQSSESFNNAWFNNFYNFYCLAFENILKKFATKKEKCVYYPSTIAIEQEVKGIKEYKLAKTIGEDICKSFVKSKKCQIIVDRLDRTESDQTVNVLRTPALNTADVAVSIANKILDNNQLRKKK